METLPALLSAVRGCQLCAEYLPLGPRPIVIANASARLLIIGQAPGMRVHESGIPWNDPSGDRLRQWLAIDRDQFYSDTRLAIMPMGFATLAKDGPVIYHPVKSALRNGMRVCLRRCRRSTWSCSLVSMHKIIICKIILKI